MAKIETYIPLYRKYRPQSFSDLVGQEAISKTLGNAITYSKIAHAYLFCGPRGTGKTSTARIFAKSLNCEQGPTVTPCQVCPSCTGITAGNALDVIEFDAASNNGVDDARELIENCQFAPIAGRFKVYIIDEVHMLSTQAFNALLKTLEEPPTNVIFIFATTEAHKVLPTIVSRCQRFDFNRITLQDIVARLKEIARKENIPIEEDAVHMIARHARGGLRDAIGLLDQVAVIGGASPEKVLCDRDIAMFIGALEEDLLLAIADTLAKKDAAVILETLTQLNNRGIEPVQLVKEITQHFRNLFLTRVSGEAITAETLAVSADYLGKLKAQAPAFEIEEYPQILSRLAGIERNIRHTQHAMLWLEVGLLEIAYRQDIFLVQDLSRRLAELEERVLAPSPGTPRLPLPKGEGRDFPPDVPPRRGLGGDLPKEGRDEERVLPSTRGETHSPGTAYHPLPKEEGKDFPPEAPPLATPTLPFWPEICRLIANSNVRALAKDHTFLIALDQEHQQVQVGCSSESILTLLRKPEKFIHFQQAVNQFFGKPMQIQLDYMRRESSGLENKITAAQPITDARAVFETEQGKTPEKKSETYSQAQPRAVIPVESIDKSVLRTDTDGLNDDEMAALSEAKQYAVQLLQGKVLE